MKITLLIPCYNEEKSIRKSAESWLAQTRPIDEIIVVNDCSKDRTAEILKEFEGRIKTITTPRNTGNKSSAQEYGLKFVTGDIFVATDGDTLLHPDFIMHMEENFKNPKTIAVGGYVKSLKYNWLTACRALDYIIGNNIDKLAQDSIDYMFVIPGAAGAFRTEIFKKHITFDHDTITEDLDFTYKLHKKGYSIKYDPRAICYTQDPTTLKAYINQMRRWYGGGWQNLIKHISLPYKPGMALELSLMYLEGIIFSAFIFILPFINIAFSLFFLVAYFIVAICLALFGGIKERRSDLLLALPGYVMLKYVNTYIYIEQFIKEVILRRKNLKWFQPERIQL